MLIWTAPSIRNCFKNAIPYEGDSREMLLYAARGEFVSMQILVRNDAQVKNKDSYFDDIIKISGAEITLSEGNDFDVSAVRTQVQEYISFSDEIAYPDALSNSSAVDIYPGTTQSIWVTFPVSETQPHGTYKFNIKLLSNTEEEISADVSLKVFDITIPASQDGEYQIEHFQTPEDQVMLNYGGYDMKVFDEKWWQFMKEYARSLRECRSNVYRVYPLELLRLAGSKRISETKWTFDFTYFDKFTAFLLENKVAQRFATDDLLTPLRGKEIISLDESGNIIHIDIADPVAEIWAEQYLSALNEHIDTEKWLIHIQDEPCDANVWMWGKRLVDKYMPGLKCGNPMIKGSAQVLCDKVDVFIPIFNAVEDDVEFFEGLLENQSKEVWAYCCCFPDEKEYLNRFIDRPALHSRLISWATYSRGFSGFLHYGYSYWQKTEQFHPYGIEKHSKFRGDCMMVYPSPEDNSYRISIRYINIRDGAQDYELLKIAEKYDKEKTAQLSKSVAEGYKNFNDDEKYFINARVKLLQLAEKGYEKKRG